MMATAPKFLFTTRFDTGLPSEEPEADSVPEPPPPPPPPTFSEAELEAARAEGYEAGRRDGRTEAEAATERQAAVALTAIAQGMEAMARQQAEMAEASVRNAVGVAMAAARKVLPEMAKRHALAEIEALFGECVGHFIEEPRVAVRVHGGVADDIRPRLEAIAEAAGFGGVLVVTADARVGLGDCRVQWGSGGAERSQEDILKTIEDIVARVLMAPTLSGNRPDAPDPAGI